MLTRGIRVGNGKLDIIAIGFGHNEQRARLIVGQVRSWRGRKGRETSVVASGRMVAGTGCWPRVRMEVPPLISPAVGTAQWHWSHIRVRYKRRHGFS